MNVISRTSALRMPTPVNTPNVRMVVISNTTRERKPRAATTPAVSITGPIRAMDSTTAARLARGRGEGAGRAKPMVLLVVALEDLDGVARRHREDQDRRGRVEDVHGHSRQTPMIPSPHTTASSAVTSGRISPCSVRKAS